MEASLNSRLKVFVQKHRLFDPQDTLVLGLSGGVDSVVLAHLLYSMGQPLVLAHCNFQLRGAESLRDEQFVRELARKWGLPVFVETVDTESYADRQKLSIQAAARQLRYHFFEQLRGRLATAGGRVFVATAHNASDSGETLLINLFRGTGIDGLKGIPVKNGFVVRPLLFATRPEIEAYALGQGLSWVEDSSNLKDHYVRNLLRLKVLPEVQTRYPNVIQNLVATTEKMQEAAALYHRMVAKLLGRMVVSEEGLQKMPVLKIAGAESRNTLLWEWIKGCGFTEKQVGEAVKLLDAATGSYMVSDTHRLLKNRNWLILSAIEGPQRAPVVIEALPASAPLQGNQWLKMQPAIDHSPQAVFSALPATEAWVDAGCLEWPLLLRPRKNGDYFYPLGMPKKKKVARLLIDLKLSVQEKEQVWVLESNRRIVWVVGHRIDDRFKITPKTKSVVKMKLVTVLPESENKNPMQS